MDSRLIRGGNTTTRVSANKPLLLKDFLLDDLGSCSSTGFKSFPRRQCCTTVPFVRNSQSNINPPKLKRRSSFDKYTAFLRSAVKRLPFRSEKMKKVKKYSLFSSFSWKRKSEGKEMEFRRLKSFDQLLKEEDSHSITCISHHPSSRSFRWPASCSAGVTECGGGGNDVVGEVEVEVGVTNDDVLLVGSTTSNSTSTTSEEGSSVSSTTTNPTVRLISS